MGQKITPSTSGWRRLFLYRGRPHPLWRAAIYLPMALFGSALLQIPLGVIYALLRLAAGDDLGALLARLTAGEAPPALLMALTMAELLWVAGVTWAFRRWLDPAPMRALGFGFAAAWREIGIGLGIGLISMGVVLGVHLLFGWATLRLAVGGWALLGTLMSMAVTLAAAAASEEIIFRGYVLPTLAGWRGWRLGLVVSSLLFGLAHLLNPNFGALALANITLAGVAFALAWRLTQRLWLAVAYHFMWNFAQGPLFGFRVSGLEFDSPMHTVVAGPALWTGGEFGPEAGLLVTTLLVITSLVMWLRLQRASSHRPKADGCTRKTREAGFPDRR